VSTTPTDRALAPTPAPSLAPTLPADAPPATRRRRWPAALTPPVTIGLVVIAFWLVVTLTVPWWSPYGPLEQIAPRLQPPGGDHWFGTDVLGRDVFSRTLHGARQSLPIALIVIVCSVAIGSLLGTAAGWFGGWVDVVVMRAADVTLAFPAILLAMAVAASLGPGLRNAFLALVVVWWPIYARLLRAQVMSVRRRDHVEAAVSIGATRGRILRKHVLPMSFTPVLVNATMDFGQVVLLTASLSFLGLGALPPSPEWGAMITEGAKNFYDWWIAVMPGIAILSVVLAFNFVGDGVRDALDPRSKGR
jgi:peptide/nickel transport system permease protein